MVYTKANIFHYFYKQCLVLLFTVVPRNSVLNTGGGAASYICGARKHRTSTYLRRKHSVKSVELAQGCIYIYRFSSYAISMTTIKGCFFKGRTLHCRKALGQHISSNDKKSLVRCTSAEEPSLLPEKSSA